MNMDGIFWYLGILCTSKLNEITSKYASIKFSTHYRFIHPNYHKYNIEGDPGFMHFLSFLLYSICSIISIAS